MSKFPLARLLVQPHCPICGCPAMFTQHIWEQPQDVDALVRVQCANTGRCDWRGLSQRTVPHPKLTIKVAGAGDQEPPQS